MRLKFDKSALEKLQASIFLESQRPIELNQDTILEIGMGKGEMLTNMAKLIPDKKFIGLEKFATVAAKALINANNYQLNNFKIVIDDAKNLDQIFKGQTNEIWLTFSDPWPKKRHTKRRLTYKSYLALYQRILSSDGLLKIKTDNDTFFAYSIESLKEANWQIIDSTNDFHNHKDYTPEFQTNYEIKWSSQGKNINYLIAKPPKPKQ
ncbi:tRNA (guanosine(46)-N7)-methyltransferase TrmB [Mycoplasmopsis hyopharyngis]|uniref:tRNA (guanosine(46)-N7)-methyltransferase TrmB n=1 Tax=Mycoplasmopsis hyopharyngis TaxID=29558 RepID=UPI003872D4A3